MFPKGVKFMGELSDEEKRLKALREAAQLSEEEVLLRRRQEEESARASSSHIRTPYEVEEPDDEMESSPFTMNVENNSTIDSDWEKVVEDYKRKYPERQLENNRLPFLSKEEATSFFEEQAAIQPPRKFMGRGFDSAGQPMDYFVLCPGNNKLYEGCANEIYNQLTAELKDNPEDQKIKDGLNKIKPFVNPSQRMRQEIQRCRPEEPEPVSSTPTPMRTTPSPC